MFLKDYCPEESSNFLLLDNKSDFTRCSQSLILFTSVSLFMLFFGIFYLFQLRRAQNKATSSEIKYRLRVLSSKMISSLSPSANSSFNAVFEHNRFHFPLFVCQFMTISSIATLCVASFESNMHDNNLTWLIWSSAWQTAAWAVATRCYKVERDHVYILGSKKAPSILISLFWVFEGILFIKNLESELIRKFLLTSTSDDNQKIHLNFSFWMQCALVIPSTYLMIFALFKSPETPNYEAEMKVKKTLLRKFLQNQQKKKMVENQN